MANIFTAIQLPKLKSSRFNLSHDVKLSFNMGQLVPVNIQECLPGDVFQISFSNMLRFAPMISPVMHRVRVKTEYFFVPTRLLWPNWEKWITGELDTLAPYVYVDTPDDPRWQPNSLADYLGFPTDVLTTGDALHFSPLAHAAYYKIFDEYYRDQNLVAEFFTPLTDGDNTGAYGPNSFRNQVLNRAWQHDYFTSALPFAQKGNSVQIPLTVQPDIPVQLVDDLSGLQQGFLHEDKTLAGTGDLPLTLGHPKDPASVTEDVFLDPAGTMKVDVQSQATDINTLRRAFKLQEWLERNARGGTRYIENIFAHFGQKSSDARLQRPELLGMSVQNMVISEVLATAQDLQDAPSDIPLGQMAGHAISVGNGRNIYYKCEEHGFIIGLVSVLPDTAYQQGIARMYTRFDRLDYAWPTFANIGEQEIKQKEIYVGSFAPEDTFGYTPRYSEYKYCPSRVSGDFRTSLSFWHLGRIFDTDPVLNSEFITANPSDRIFAVQDDEVAKISAHVFNSVTVKRKLPYFGIPSF